MFRNRGNSTRTINCVDVDGVRTIHRQAGHLNTITHMSVLSALEHRANRYRKKGNMIENEARTHSWNMDETGTIDTSLLDHGETLQQEQEIIRGVSEEILQVHGVLPGRKEEGITRLLYENANGLSNRMCGNQKLSKAKDLIDELCADIVAMNEHRQNLRHTDNRNGWNQLFKGGEADVRSVVAHNIHESEGIGRTQEGGTGLLMFGQLTEYLDMPGSEKDATGLGRWTTMLLKGEGVQTRIVCGYNPCSNKRSDSRTSYQQQRRFFIMHQQDHRTCPRTKFREDLIHLLKKWRAAGDRIVVCLDANEDIYRKAIGKALTEEGGLDMKEVVGAYTGKRIGPTFFRGQLPIDGVWATPDITVSNACIMPAGYGIGDHRLFVIDFHTSSLIGTGPPRARRASSRRLTTRLPHVARKYAASLEANIIRHRLIEKLGKAHTLGCGKADTQRRINQVDKHGGQFMTHAERICRKLKSGRICFSPESVIWIKREQIYRSLVEYKQGRKKNRGNLKRAARAQKIEKPFQISMAQLMINLEVCKERNDYFRTHGARYRKKHLLTRAGIAREEGREEAAAQILAIIKREQDRSFWRRMNYTCGKTRTPPPTSVQVEGPNESVTEHVTQASVHDAIWTEIHYKRFHLAEEAPVCQGQLRQDLGYNAVSETARAILDGSYIYPESFDQATKELCQECALIRQIVPKDSVRIKITKEEHRGHWRKAKEETSSSKSGYHFGHYKAGSLSEYIDHFHALKATLVLHHGLVLERWSQGLSVMLQKLFGCTLITKLRSILLMEADFNSANKQIYGIRMLGNARQYNLMPEEVYSERNRMADDGTLTKVIAYDIIRQTRRPAGIASVDADNCYDRIAHAIASLVFQAFGVPATAADSMLTTIQEMKFFLRTGFGDSTDFASSQFEIKTQGLCQGNGASPAGWAVVSICLINAHKKKGHGGHFICPITKLRSHIAGVIYVDDTDLIHFRMDELEDREDSFFGLQEAIVNWGKLLLASGGALKPSKCFYHLISFKFKGDGTWVYEDNEDNEEFRAVVPLADGSFAHIEHLGVHEPTKTLGSMTCPSGCTKGALKYMTQKASAWKDMIQVGKLSRRHVWFMLEKQFWPRVSYGLCAVSASYDELSECLMKVYYQIQPQGGIRRSARRGIRQLDLGFYGVGCPHPAIECLIAQLNKLLMHYGNQSCLGIQMKNTAEQFVLELGMSPQPFQEDFSACHLWVTHSWMKSLWEKAFRLKIDIELADLPVKPPRERDSWLMQEFTTLNYSCDDLRRLNRVRLHQEVLFLSDVMDASGRAIDKKYLHPRPMGEAWSTLSFPIERPPRRDFNLWQTAIRSIRALGGRLHLGNYVTQGHKIWAWSYDLESMTLFHRKGDLVDIYKPSDFRGARTRANRYSRTRHDQCIPPRGGPCTVEEAGLGIYKIMSFTTMPPQVAHPETFLEVLEEWGSMWMWKDMRLTGDDSWLAEAISDNSLVAVTDGSYMRSLYPNMNSCAFILECSKGRGRLTGSFSEQTIAACSYRGELLGLMAIHLILLSVNRVNPNLRGSAHIYSDCLGALDKIRNLPPHRIPSKCRHSDVLKNVMIHCSSLSFTRLYSHVSAHQDDRTRWENLSREEQLNCAADFGAKRVLLSLEADRLPRQQKFPLEAVCVWAGREKMTSDTGHYIRYHANLQLARGEMAAASLLTTTQFDLVDWQMVHKTLCGVPRMFQVWACKQVWSIAPTNYELSRWSPRCPLCPSCRQVRETCAHVLHCTHEGRVDALHATIKLLDQWMKKRTTDPSLRECIYEYATGRGGVTMEEICVNRGYDGRYLQMAKSQDSIGWRRFMEGMVCKGIRAIQDTYTALSGSSLSAERWTEELITKLLEVTHGQWLYRNIQVHDKVTGTLATLRKEEIQMEIEEQQALGTEGLMEEDCHLGECNLGDLEDTSGIKETYWLLAIKAAREAGRLEALRIQTDEVRTTT